MIPTPASAAVDGSVEQLPFPDFAPNEFVGEVFSSDLSTAAFTRDPAPLVGDPAPNAGITTVVDLSTGELRQIQPDRGFSDQLIVQLDGDGSHLLMSSNWQGVVAGDADDGAADLFLVDTAVDDVVALTAGLSGELFEAIGVSDDALTVVFGSGDVEGSDQLHVWQDGTISDITTVGTLDTFEPTALSGDGTTLLYSTRSGTVVTWHVQTLATGDEVTIVAPTVFDAHLSNDGSIVAGTEADADPDSTDAVVWRTDVTEITRIAVPGTTSLLSGDGSALVGGATDTGLEPTNIVWRLDIATGEVTVVLETSKRFRNVVAVSDDGNSLVAHTVPSAIGVRPVPVDFYFEELERFFLIDLSNGPAPVPGYTGTLDAQLVRLYDAYFDRAPDGGGLEFWRNQRASGQGLFGVSAAFARSPEFVATYGELDNDAFIDLMYANVLDRSPDVGGKAFWLDQLAQGRSRGTVMALFSESPEFIDRTGTLPSENSIAAAVRRLYAGYFGRSADAAGLAFWISQAEQGRSLEAISSAFLSSVEFTSLYSPVLDDFGPGVDVNDGRAVAVIGFGNTVGTVNEDMAFELGEQVLGGDISLADVMIMITNAPEFVALTSSSPVAG